MMSCSQDSLGLNNVQLFKGHIEMLTHLAPDKLQLFRYEIPCEGK